MWHEARKQERKIRVMMVDYQKRADRRRQFYEQIKLDPTQFVRVYGRPVKIHLDPAVAMTAEGPQIMQPWQGNTDIMIDRYDVRTHMDYIPEISSSSSTRLSVSSDEEESRCCYERYRILVQNECAGVSEEQCLHQIFVDEQFGALDNPVAKKAEEDKKRLAEKKAAIGYTYEDSSTPVDPNDEDDESSDEEIDLDNILDIDALNDEQEQVLNNISLEYGMKGMDYADCLQIDREEVEALRQARQLEEEKAQFSGRKSRRERRAFKEKRMKNRPPSPPSYAAKETPKKTTILKALSSSRSRSKSPPVPGAGVVEFITSFGGDSDNEGVVHGPTLPPPQMHKKLSSSSRSYRSRSRDRSSDRRRNSSDNRSRSRTHSKSSQQSSSRRDARTSSSSQRRSRSRSIDCKYRHDSESLRSRDFKRNEHDRYRERSGQRDYGSYSSQKTYSRRTSGDRDRGYDGDRTDRYSRSAVSNSGGKIYTSSRSSRRNSRSRSRSRSISKPHARATSRSRSKSSSRADNRDRVPSPPPVKSYRRPSLSSKSSSDFSSDDESATKSSSTTGPLVGSGKDVTDDRSQDSTSNKAEQSKFMFGKVEGTSTKNALTPQERLKRKMQVVLNRQLKADKRAQKEKEVKEEQIRLDREEELRLIAVQMRQRERERRHREREQEDSELEKSGHFDDDDDRPARYRRRSTSRSPSPTQSVSRARREKRQRSRSASPHIPRLVDY